MQTKNTIYIEKYVDTNNNGVFDSDYIDFTKNWISPFGKIFLNLIKLLLFL